MKDFRNLRVWEKAHKLCLDVYEITATFPTDEANGLTTKIRQVATNIPIAIARGCGYNSQKEYMKHIQIAANLTCEFEYLTLLSSELGYILKSDQEALSEKILEVRRMLFALVASIRNKIKEGKGHLGTHVFSGSSESDTEADPGNNFYQEFMEEENSEDSI